MFLTAEVKSRLAVFKSNTNMDESIAARFPFKAQLLQVNPPSLLNYKERTDQIDAMQLIFDFAPSPECGVNV